MPKKHYDNFLEMPNEEYGKLMEKVQLLSKKLMKNLEAPGCNILINTNEVAGQSVMHTHVHIIPRYELGDSIKLLFTENKFDLDKILEKINQD